jgi:hypothetical protein
MYQAGLEIPDRLKCPVKDCGYWADGANAAKKINVHLSARHDDVEGLEVSEVPVATPQEGAGRRPGRPAKPKDAA